MRHLLSVSLLFESFHMGVEAQEIAPVKVQLENRTVENGRNAWTTPQFRVDADAGVLIRADYFLNAVVVQKSRNTPKMDEDLVVHELVHLCMHQKLSGLPQWFVDGVAEYFGSAHSGGGKYWKCPID